MTILTQTVVGSGMTRQLQQKQRRPRHYKTSRLALLRLNKVLWLVCCIILLSFLGHHVPVAVESASAEAPKNSGDDGGGGGNDDAVVDGAVHRDTLTTTTTTTTTTGTTPPTKTSTSIATNTTNTVPTGGSSPNGTSSTTAIATSTNGTTVLDFAQSIRVSKRQFVDPEIKAMRKTYWTKAFDDIRQLAANFTAVGRRNAGNNNDVTGVLLNQWKLLLDDDTPLLQNTNRATGYATLTKSTSRSASNTSTTVGGKDLTTTGTGGEGGSDTPSSMKRRRTMRFDGFPTWERMIQDWADDVQDYLEKASSAAEDGYRFSNFGRPLTMSSSPGTAESIDQASLPVDTSTDGTASEVTSQRKNKFSLPVPVPARPGEAVLPHTDLSDLSKRILIVTTAAMPWRTGTAVNPLLRAAYLLEGRTDAGGSVTLMLPWLERPDDQARVYGDKNKFESPEQQESWIRTWLRESANLTDASQTLAIQWYTAWQNPVENSIYSMGDITALIPAGSIDICILEEPEHLNWYRAPGESWTKKFPHVVGILHTNYFSYALDQPAALIRAPGMRLLVSWMCRAHCHRVIKLSGTLDKVAPEKELVENVHGVRSTFLDVGEEVSRRLRSPVGKDDPVFGAAASPSVYFIGKLLWSKGLGSLMELLRYAEESADLHVKVDMYGGGPDKAAAEARATKLGLDMPFLGPVDHSEIAFTHKIFLNPSTSEVLCTTSAEALAMGKFVILPSHPSNDFFAQFPNCLSYTTKEEFVGFLYYALTHSPEPLSEEYSYALTWKAATERLKAAACIPQQEAALVEAALASEEAGIEIALPPLVESAEGRKALATTFRNTRDRFRQFRSNLSADVRQSKVLPKPLRESIASELDKRFDVVIDEILESPKLRLQLSPAELDKSLLDLYDRISESPSGDVLRVIGGGGPIGLQNLYMKRQAAKTARRKLLNGGALDLLPYFAGDIDALTKEDQRSPAQWVRLALSRNLPSKSAMGSLADQRSLTSKKVSDQFSEKESPKMCGGTWHNSLTKLTTWQGFRAPSSLQVRRANKFSVLI